MGSTEQRGPAGSGPGPLPACRAARREGDPTPEHRDPHLRAEAVFLAGVQRHRSPPAPSTHSRWPS